MAHVNYDYLAGFVDGEGSFIVTISPRKRKYGKTSLALYMWISIGQSHDGMELLENVADFLNKDGIKARVKFYRSEGKTEAQLRVAAINSLDKLCYRLSGKLLLKQETLENFQLILQLRKEHSQQRPTFRFFKGFCGGGTLKCKKWTKNLIDYYRTIAIVWDNSYRAKNREPHFYETKLFAILKKMGIA